MINQSRTTLWSAVVGCIGRYAGYFCVILAVTIVLTLLQALAAVIVIFFVANFAAIAPASYQTTKAHDARRAQADKRTRGFWLVICFSVTLLLPWVGLPFAIAPAMPDTMAGGYVMVGIAMNAVLGGPISSFLGALLGVFLAR